MRPLASWRRARWFSSFFDQRMRMPRLRFSQEWQASTTQRRARQSGSAGLLVDLLAASADVRRRTVSATSVADVRVVIAVVQAQPLGRSAGWVRPPDRDRVECVLQQLVIVAVRAVVREPDRDPRGLGEDRALRPPLALSVGFGPVFGPPNGAFVIAPSAASNDQSIPTSRRSRADPDARSRGKRRPAPTPESAGARVEEHTPVTSSAFHCIPVRAPARSRPSPRDRAPAG